MIIRYNLISSIASTGNIYHHRRHYRCRFGFFSNYLIENRRERRERKKENEFRERIKSIVRQELEIYHKFLNTQIVKFRQVPSDSPLKKAEYRATFTNKFNDLSRHVFDTDTLVTLEKVYQDIRESTLLDLEWEKFEGSIKMMIGNVGDGLRSLQNMKID